MKDELHRLFGLESTPKRFDVKLGFASNLDNFNLTGYEAGRLYTTIKRLRLAVDSEVLKFLVPEDVQQRNALHNFIEDGVLLYDSNVVDYIRDFMAGCCDMRDEAQRIRKIQDMLEYLCRTLFAKGQNKFSINLEKIKDIDESKIIDLAKTDGELVPVTVYAFMELGIDTLEFQESDGKIFLSNRETPEDKFEFAFGRNAYSTCEAMNAVLMELIHITDEVMYAEYRKKSLQFIRSQLDVADITTGNVLKNFYLK